MPIHNRIAAFHPEMTAWRQDLHRHPELALEEHRTSAVIQEKLKEFGVDEVVTGMARTGVVGVIRGSAPGGAIGLRADIDALPIIEQTNLPYASTNPGVMHACGHDGHTTMLLGAAKYLAETRNFAGTVYVIFQPAEEQHGGGEIMVKEGLFERFPMDQIFGMHNWPKDPEGTFLWRVGPTMAAVANITIVVTGKGAHGAQPHNGVDPIVVSGAIVSALQSIVARNVEPTESAVVTIGEIKGGNAFNVIPPDVTMRGTARWFTPAVGDLLEKAVIRIAHATAEAYGATAEVTFARTYPAVVNDEAATALAKTAAEAVVGAARVVPMEQPTMGGEDFSFMLNAKQGNYIMLGAGKTGNDPQVHHPLYDFNDDILPVGASYWATLAEQLLPRDPR
ncbi:M20 aminoacylase family protein [Lichenifustis flavocetrariae]|uniref:M20 family metallopeptidase n=1 Tax=Lichenifustis flavocetrariae TaxID=2949735 RepID=A0AA41YWV8_9HYPH|nr:M20 aminoacylase family protein [Lichenifustis flavocetrariae]MCW6508741.1 M20 family metallopeptidase [Lichenifustis flavocetrariae]